MATLDGTLAGLTERLRELLQTTAADPDQWDDPRLKRRLNETQQWMWHQLLAVYEEFETELFNVTLTNDSEINLPPDFVREVSFAKNMAPAGETEDWQQVRILRAGAAHGYGAEEVWITQRGKLVTPNGEQQSGDYRIRYIQRLPDMQSDADVCPIPAEFHEPLLKRAAMTEAYAVQEINRAQSWEADVERWRTDIKETQGFLKSLRPSTIEPITSDTSDPNRGEIRERVRTKLLGVVPETAAFSDQRINWVINESQQWIQNLTLGSAFHQWEVIPHEFVMSGTSYVSELPARFLVDVQLKKEVDGKWVQQRLVGPNEASGYEQSESALEAWTIRGEKLHFAGTSAPVGKYQLEYVASLPDLVKDTDTSLLPGFLIPGLTLRSAYCLASSVGGSEALSMELEAWKGSIPEASEAISTFRAATTQPLYKLKEGSLGQVREEVRNMLSTSSVKDPDFWTDPRLDLAIRNALRLTHQKILLSRGPFYHEEKHYQQGVDFRGGQEARIPLPTNYFREISFDKAYGSGQYEPMLLLRPSQHASYRGAWLGTNAKTNTNVPPNREPWTIKGNYIQYAGYGAPTTENPVSGSYRLVYQRQVKMPHSPEDIVDVPAEYLTSLTHQAAVLAAQTNGAEAAGMAIAATLGGIDELLRSTASKRSMTERTIVMDVMFYGDF